jgi:hypothetical protein
MKRLKRNKLKGVGGKEQHRFDISNSTAALDNVDAEMDINKAWGTARDKITILTRETVDCYELEKHK